MRDDEIKPGEMPHTSRRLSDDAPFVPIAYRFLALTRRSAFICGSCCYFIRLGDPSLSCSLALIVIYLPTTPLPTLDSLSWSGCSIVPSVHALIALLLRH